MTPTTQQTFNHIEHHRTVVRRFTRAWDRWDRKWDAFKHNNGPRPGRAPSKNAKWRAYDSGHIVAEHFGLPMPTTLNDLRALV